LKKNTQRSVVQICTSLEKIPDHLVVLLNDGYVQQCLTGEKSSILAALALTKFTFTYM
jgi:hypothetical protein